MFKLHVYSQTGDIDEQVVIEGDSATIGRSSECNVVLDRMDISRRHARLMRGFVIDDLGSRNGTHVDGVRVDEARLISDRCFEVGDPSGENLVTIEVISADKPSEAIKEPENLAPTLGGGARIKPSKPPASVSGGPEATGIYALRAEFEAITEQYRFKCARLELELTELRRKFESFEQPPPKPVEPAAGPAAPPQEAPRPDANPS